MFHSVSFFPPFLHLSFSSSLDLWLWLWYCSARFAILSITTQSNLINFCYAILFYELFTNQTGEVIHGTCLRYSGYNSISFHMILMPMLIITKLAMLNHFHLKVFSFFRYFDLVILNLIFLFFFLLPSAASTHTHMNEQTMKIMLYGWYWPKHQQCSG